VNGVIKRFWPLWLFLLLAALFAKALINIDRGVLDPHAIQSPLLNKAAPAFDLPALQNAAERVRSSDYRGRFVVFNVWGSWCVACREEHESLLKLQLERGVEIVGIDWKDDPNEAQRYLQKLGNPYRHVAVDRDGSIAINYGVYGAPESFLIAPNGVIVAKHTGPLTVEAFAQEFAPLMNAEQRL